LAAQPGELHEEARMQLVTAVVKPHMLDEVKDALKGVFCGTYVVHEKCKFNPYTHKYSIAYLK
jgi:hypothetical protein